MGRYSAKISGYLHTLYSEESRAFACRAGDRREWETWTGAARPELRRLLGIDRIRESLGAVVPSVSVDPAIDREHYTLQAGTLRPEPHLEIPFWYLKPKSPGPHPLALLPHGHYHDRGLDWAIGLAPTEDDRQRIVDEDRDVALQAVAHGFAAVAPATRGFLPSCIPDVNERHGGSNCRSQLMHALLAGRTVMGERVWDLSCLIDWAESQPDVDASNVLMMGNSGGGTATVYAAACDPRITIAVASCSFCTLVGRDGRIHHCDCNAVPGMMRFGEFYDVAGLIAPRAFLAVHGRNDPLFPPQEVERAAVQARRIFTAADAAERFELRHGEGGHRFYKELMWPFVERQLHGSDRAQPGS